jgi:predicted enzyme related to lactoylglutathione lyase
VVSVNVTGVAFIMYPVSDMERAARFYSDVVGLRKSGLESDFWVEFDVDGTTFGIGNFEQVGAVGSAGSLSLEVADMTAARSALSAAGVETFEPFETQICFISGFSDPDGNRVWLHQAKSQAA